MECSNVLTTNFNLKKGLILCIITGDEHQFIVYFLIPLDPWFWLVIWNFYILISNSFKTKSCKFKTRPAAAAVFSCHLFKPAIHSQTLKSFEHLLFLSLKNSCKEWTFSLICLWKLEKKFCFVKLFYADTLLIPPYYMYIYYIHFS